MKKIFFCDRFGMTQAVKDEIKNNTRRVAKDICHSLVSHVSELHNIEVGRDGFTITYSTGVRQHVFPAYQVGEEVAVAQSYESIIVGDPGNAGRNYFLHNLRFTPGWWNKMFVKAELMPLRIRITNIRFERLQDISEEDCLREGLLAGKQEPKMYGFKLPKGTVLSFMTPRDAFAALIDKISGKGTWEKNPWVFVYEFELVK